MKLLLVVPLMMAVGLAGCVSGPPAELAAAVERIEFRLDGAAGNITPQDEGFSRLAEEGARVLWSLEVPAKAVFLNISQDLQQAEYARFWFDGERRVEPPRHTDRDGLEMDNFVVVFRDQAAADIAGTVVTCLGDACGHSRSGASFAPLERMLQ